MPKGKTGDSEFYVINKTYKIDTDRKYNFILKRKAQVGGEDGKVWKTIGFYQTVKQLYHALVELEIKTADIKTLNDKVSELHQLIDQASGIMTATKEGVIDG